MRLTSAVLGRDASDRYDNCGRCFKKKSIHHSCHTAEGRITALQPNETSSKGRCSSACWLSWAWQFLCDCDAFRFQPLGLKAICNVAI